MPTDGQPDRALRPQHALEATFKDRSQPRRMEGPSPPIDEAADPILLGLGNVAALHFLKPTLRLLDAFEIEQARIENQVERNPSLGRLGQSRRLVELAQDSDQSCDFSPAHLVGLVENDDVG